jgi:hypothetical protein
MIDEIKNDSVYSWGSEVRDRLQTLRRLSNCRDSEESPEVASSRLLANFSPQEITQELKARGYSLDLGELTSEQILEAVRSLSRAELQDWQDLFRSLASEAVREFCLKL